MRMYKGTISILIVALLFLNTIGFANTNSNANESGLRDGFEGGLGNWQQQGNDFKAATVNGSKQLVLKSKSNQINPSVIVAGKTDWQNYRVGFKLTPAGGQYAGVLLRYQSKDTHYLLKFFLESQTVKLFKKVKGGLYVELASGKTSIAYGQAAQVDITLQGAQIDCVVDGNKVLSAQDAAIGSGRVGFWGLMTEFAVDDVGIELDARQVKYIYPNEKIDFGLQTVYPEITGKTVKERFEQRIAELPDEVPVVLPRTIQGETKLFVATDGNDIDAGTIEKPLKTMQRALSIVSSLSTDKRNKGVVIYLRGGKYSLEDSIGINEFNGGTQDAPLCISSYNGENVEFVGGTAIPGSSFKKITDQKKKDRLYPLAKENVLVSDLKALGITQYGTINYKDTAPQVTLFLDGEKQTLARWPNATTVTIGKVLDPGPRTSHGEANDGRGFEFVFDNQRPLNWLNDGDLGMNGSFYAEWDKEIVNIKEIKKETSSVRTAQVTDFGEGALELKTNHYFYFNIFEELDMPGEWYLDRNEGKLYVYPTTDLSGKDFSLVINPNNLINMKNAYNVILNGIKLSVCSGNGIEITNGTNNIIQNCTIQKIAGKGAFIVGGEKNGVICSTFTGTDMQAIRINGSEDEMRYLKPSRNYIQNCHFYGDSNDINNNVMMYRTVGTIVSHNLVQNSSAVGIYVYEALESIIEYNEVTGGPRLVADSSTVYVGGNLVNRGNHIRYNHLHHTSIENATSATIGVYFDDMNRDNYAYGNVIDTVPTPIFSHNGQELVAYNNVMMNKISNSNYAFNDSLNYYRAPRDTQWDFLIYNTYQWMQMHWRGMIDVYSKPWITRFPTVAQMTRKAEELKTMRSKVGYVRGVLEDDLRASSHYYIANNLVVNHGKINLSDVALKTTEGLETNYSTTEDPGFVDAANSNFDFKKDAVVFDKIPGFVAPAYDKIGLVYGDGVWKEKAKMGDMECLSPVNQSQGRTIHESVIFDWTSSFGSTFYTLMIATDPNFENVVGKYRTEFSKYTVPLEKMGQTYYWKVIAESTARGVNPTPKQSPVWSFRTMTQQEIEVYGTVDKQYLQREIDDTKKLLETIVEGTKLGQYQAGAKDALKAVIEQVEQVLATAKIQGKIDQAIKDLKKGVNALKTKTNRGYQNITQMSAGDWNLFASTVNLTAAGNEISVTTTSNSSVARKELVGAGEVLTFKMYIENLRDWMGISKQTVLNSSPVRAGTTDSYVIIFKPDVLELQKYSNGAFTMVQVIPNDSKLVKSATWHDMKFGVIPTEKGVWITLVVDGQTIFDHIDEKEDAIYADGYFGVALNSNNGAVKIKPTDTVYQEPIEPQKRD